MNYILKWILFPNEKKVGVYWQLVIGKKYMLTKLNKLKYAHKDNRFVTSWCCLFSFESFVKKIF
jgi:hypothetical protein